MAKKKDSIEYGVLQYLAEVGATVDSREQGKHIKIKYSIGKHKFVITVPSTVGPGRRTKHNMFSHIKRSVREANGEI